MGSTSNDLSTAIQQMLETVAQNDELKRGLRMATTAAAVSEVAAQAGIHIEPAALVKHTPKACSMLLMQPQSTISISAAGMPESFSGP